MKETISDCKLFSYQLPNSLHLVVGTFSGITDNWPFYVGGAIGIEILRPIFKYAGAKDSMRLLDISLEQLLVENNFFQEEN